ncbi:MAG: hypothetical protein H6657_14710 [Ardenticatenaceae bacterium]|nr:hypothetical protein [Ardenticatenaceae bacterium]
MKCNRLSLTESSVSLTN